MASDSDHEVFELGDLRLQHGGTLPSARLAFRTWGQLNGRRDNCIVFPTYYTGDHAANARIIGAGHALDPADWFIVVPNMFGNGVSSSPSNTTGHRGGGRFPHVSLLDNVVCQYRLIVQHLGVRRIALATGWSMGGMQAYQWAVLFPDLVERLLPVCATARCWPQNHVFLEGVQAALRADTTFQDGFYTRPPEAGLRAFGRTYAGWAYSAAFFRQKLHEVLGHRTVEELLLAWEDDHLAYDANDLLAMLRTWQNADASANDMYRGNFPRALSSIRARTIVMPCDQDAYFTLPECLHEASLIRDAELRPLRSAYGHCAGAPGRFPDETQFVDEALRDVLAR
ncbi:MAG: alpha/beta fold hydrolase [Betaproteobacteria bacterium]|nr:alpha/beta fold hydrolase [Betaproteobacteria bacterium]